MSFFSQAKNFEISNSTFIDASGGVRSGAKRYNYYQIIV